MMIIQIWYNGQDEENEEYTFLSKGDSANLWMIQESELIKEISGKDWNDCMIKVHEFLGWEPYKPF